MNLFLLRPTEENEIWEPWYDKYFGFVVRAETESNARAMISGKNITLGDECDRLTGFNPWQSPENTTCVKIADDVNGEAEILMSDFHAA
jgi:hypothetical protein